MKILESANENDYEEDIPTCSRDYFGKLIVIPQSINWIATDADGEIWGFVSKPRVSEHVSSWLCIKSSQWYSGCTCLGKADLEGIDWRDTLMEIE